MNQDDRIVSLEARIAQLEARIAQLERDRMQVYVPVPQPIRVPDTTGFPPWPAAPIIIC